MKQILYSKVNQLKHYPYQQILRGQDHALICQGHIYGGQGHIVICQGNIYRGQGHIVICQGHIYTGQGHNNSPVSDELFLECY